MATTKSWIKAARPRTLPLALAGIIIGSGLAWFYHEFDLGICMLALITATLLQIFSNFANDYGDFKRGTDNKQRLGPTRTMQGGEITKKEMEAGMAIVIILCLVFGFWLVYRGMWKESHSSFFWFLFFGILSLLAAYFYTAGKKSYGYIGLGDLAVFLFFGLLPVMGTFYINAQFLNLKIILPAISIGFFSAGVLNLNNIRDIENDRQSGKITLAVKMGVCKGKCYHACLIIFGMLAVIIFTTIQFYSFWQWLFLLSVPLFIADLIRIFKIKEAKLLDPFLKRLALSTFAFSILFVTGLFLS